MTGHVIKLSDVYAEIILHYEVIQVLISRKQGATHSHSCVDYYKGILKSVV